MSTDSTQPINPETPDLTFAVVSEALKKFFAEGVKFHNFCGMIEQKDMDQALHTFLKAYNVAGITCSTFLEKAQEGDAEAFALVKAALIDMHGFITLLILFDEVLTKHLLEPGSKASGNNTYV